MEPIQEVQLENALPEAVNHLIDYFEKVMPNTLLVPEGRASASNIDQFALSSPAFALDFNFELASESRQVIADFFGVDQPVVSRIFTSVERIALQSRALDQQRFRIQKNRVNAESSGKEIPRAIVEANQKRLGSLVDQVIDTVGQLRSEIAIVLNDPNIEANVKQLCVDLQEFALVGSGRAVAKAGASSERLRQLVAPARKDLLLGDVPESLISRAGNSRFLRVHPDFEAVEKDLEKASLELKLEHLLSFGPVTTDLDDAFASVGKRATRKKLAQTQSAFEADFKTYVVKQGRVEASWDLVATISPDEIMSPVYDRSTPRTFSGTESAQVAQIIRATIQRHFADIIGTSLTTDISDLVNRNSVDQTAQRLKDLLENETTAKYFQESGLIQSGFVNEHQATMHFLSRMISEDLDFMDDGTQIDRGDLEKIIGRVQSGRLLGMNPARPAASPTATVARDFDEVPSFLRPRDPEPLADSVPDPDAIDPEDLPSFLRPSAEEGVEADIDAVFEVDPVEEVDPRLSDLFDDDDTPDLGDEEPVIGDASGDEVIEVSEVEADLDAEPAPVGEPVILDGGPEPEPEPESVVTFDEPEPEPVASATFDEAVVEPEVVAPETVVEPEPEPVVTFDEPEPEPVVNATTFDEPDVGAPWWMVNGRDRAETEEVSEPSVEAGSAAPHVDSSESTEGLGADDLFAEPRSEKAKVVTPDEDVIDVEVGEPEPVSKDATEPDLSAPGDEKVFVMGPGPKVDDKVRNRGDEFVEVERGEGGTYKFVKPEPVANSTVSHTDPALADAKRARTVLNHIGSRMPQSDDPTVSATSTELKDRLATMLEASSSEDYFKEHGLLRESGSVNVRAAAQHFATRLSDDIALDVANGSKLDLGVADDLIVGAVPEVLEPSLATPTAPPAGGHMGL